MASKATRCFNTASFPVVVTYNSKEHLFQPKDGGYFVMANESFADPRGQDPDPEVAKAWRKAVLKKRVPIEDKVAVKKKLPNWRDVDVGFVDFIRNGPPAERLALQALENGLHDDRFIKTLEELDRTNDSLMEDKHAAIAAADKEILVREQRIAALKAQETELAAEVKAPRPKPAPKTDPIKPL